jgi:hypothetical protein
LWRVSWHWNCGLFINVTRWCVPIKMTKNYEYFTKVVFLPLIVSEIRYFILFVSRKTVSNKNL